MFGHQFVATVLVNEGFCNFIDSEHLLVLLLPVVMTYSLIVLLIAITQILIVQINIFEQQLFLISFSRLIFFNKFLLDVILFLQHSLFFVVGAEVVVLAAVVELIQLVMIKDFGSLIRPDCSGLVSSV